VKEKDKAAKRLYILEELLEKNKDIKLLQKLICFISEITAVRRLRWIQNASDWRPILRDEFDGRQ
jgi:hypothetical protein